MLHPAHYVLRHATYDDGDAIRRLAALDSSRAPQPPVLIGEIDGRPAAALSLSDGHAVSDPFRPTAQLLSYLRVRSNALRAVDAEPSLRRRILAVVPSRLRNPAAA
ncbi:MAG TPA: hypothetical protein VF587_07390 [Solirubrobacteraceae bacterium]|jgi:hypothetical protein